jgi:hypothetical protein
MSDPISLRLATVEGLQSLPLAGPLTYPAAVVA